MIWAGIRQKAEGNIRLGVYYIYSLGVDIQRLQQLRGTLDRLIIPTENPTTRDSRLATRATRLYLTTAGSAVRYLFAIPYPLSPRLQAIPKSREID